MLDLVNMKCSLCLHGKDGTTVWLPHVFLMVFLDRKCSYSRKKALGCLLFTSRHQFSVCFDLFYGIC